MFEKTPLPGLCVVRPRRIEDQRGFFSEVWSDAAFRAEGVDIAWVQDNHARSDGAGILRGLHCQRPPSAQAKLVRCIVGSIWDVAVDVRRGSPTERQSLGIELSAENWTQLLVPRGFLHGYLTLLPGTEVLYKVDNPYDLQADSAIAWNDPDFDVEWPLDRIGVAPFVSEKDRAASRFADWDNPFVWEG